VALGSTSLATGGDRALIRNILCHPNKANCYKSKMWLKEYWLHYFGANHQRKWPSESNIICKMHAGPICRKALAKAKSLKLSREKSEYLPFADHDSQKEKRSDRSACHVNNAYNIVFRFQCYTYDFSHYARAQELYWLSLRHHFCRSFKTWTYKAITPNIISVSVLFFL
jgi:hypothetical protein